MQPFIWVALMMSALVSHLVVWVEFCVTTKLMYRELGCYVLIKFLFL